MYRYALGFSVGAATAVSLLNKREPLNKPNRECGSCAPSLDHQKIYSLKQDSNTESCSAQKFITSSKHLLGPQRLQVNAAEKDEDPGDVFHMREQRFLDFASVYYNGEVYMTPQDFLHSVTQEGARARKYRIAIDESQAKLWLRSTPKRRQKNTRLFRDLNEKGLISYVEYLFLLCILTEPKSGFEIAFDMFDVDGNKKVDINEFKVLTRLFSNKKIKVYTGKSGTEEEIEMPDWVINPTKSTLERILLSASQHQLSPDAMTNAVGSSEELPLNTSETEKARQHQQTTLLVHLFGERGNEVLKYEDFARFTQDLQEEVLDMEFQQYARGLKTISEEDFARILLRYTNLSEASIEEYLNRVSEHIIHAQGITFDDFKGFFIFLNHLDDFILMMRLYNLTDHPISKDEFRRAVGICGGEDISRDVIDAVYTIFDVDGDGHLSTEEFISIMKSRLKRGIRSHLVKEEYGWTKFKNCVRHEMRLKRGGM